MKSERIIEALGKIDDRLIVEVIPGMPIKRNNRWPTIVAAAAVVGLCLFGAGKIGLLPAVPEQQPIEETTTPREVDWTAVWEKLLAAPDPDGIDADIKLEFLHYFQENYDPTFQILLDWEWRFAVSDSYQNTLCPTLFCEGQTDTVTAVNKYVYYQGEVCFAGQTTQSVNAVEDAILAAFPEANITAMVQLQNRKGQLQQFSYELLSYDGFDVGGKATLSNALYMEELALTQKNTYETAGTLVFLDHSRIPTYFVEKTTRNVYLTRSGRVTNGYAVWAVRDPEIAEEYQSFLQAAGDHLHDKWAECDKKQVILRGTVRDIDYDDHILTLHGAAVDDEPQAEPIEVYFSDKDLFFEQDFMLRAYAAEDCGFARTENVYYSQGYAAEHHLSGTVEGLEWNLHRLNDYLRILENREPMQGNSVSVDFGNLDLYLELPENWNEKYGMVILDDGVEFYHLDSKGAKAGGSLFTIRYVTEEQMTYAGFERLLFSGEDYMIGVFTPTDVQFTAETAKEYQAMEEQTGAIVDSAFLESKQETAEIINWTVFEERFHQEQYFPGAELVGKEARVSMLKFIREDPIPFASYFGGRWSWTRLARNGKEYAVLNCEAPLRKETCVSQNFEYCYEDGTIAWGASGAHGGDRGNDVAEIIRYDLQYHVGNPNFQTNLRKEFALYFYEHPEQLQFLTSANQGDPVYEREDEVMYYRLRSITLVNEEQRIFEAEFEGMSMYRSDLQNSENWRIVQENYPWRDYYGDAEQEAIIQSMASDQTYQEQGLTVSQRLHVDFYMQDGDHPFSYCACTREIKDDDAGLNSGEAWMPVELSSFSMEQVDWSVDDSSGEIVLLRVDDTQVRYPLSPNALQAATQYYDEMYYKEAICCIARDNRLMLFVPPFAGDAVVACSEDAAILEKCQTVVYGL